MLVLEYNATLISLDANILGVAKHCGVPAVGIQSLLAHGRSKGTISPRDCSISQLQLSLSNRTFVGLSAIDFAFGLYQGADTFQAVVYQFKRAVSSRTVNVASLIAMAVEFCAFAVKQLNCERLALMEMLEHFLEGLFRHPAIDNLTPVDIYAVMRSGLSAADVCTVIGRAKVASALPLTDRPIHIAILKCSSPPVVSYEPRLDKGIMCSLHREAEQSPA